MLMIRLSRIGKKNKPLYRLIISQKQKDLYGDSLEILGSYNPNTKDLKINAEKTKYWLSKGAQMSPTVNNLLIEKKIIEGKRVKASKDRKDKKAPAAEAKPAKTEASSADAPAKTAPAEAKPASPAGGPAKTENTPTPAVAEAPKTPAPTAKA